MTCNSISIMENIVTRWSVYQKAVENKTEPRALRSAFVAGMKAALDMLADPYKCPTCLDLTEALAKEIDDFGGKKES